MKGMKLKIKIKLLFLFLFLFFSLIINLEPIFSQDKSQNGLVTLNEFQQYSSEKKISYLKEAIPKFLYELKLVYYITSTDKPKDLFILWENSIKNDNKNNNSSNELIIKKQLCLLLIYTFQEKISYLERNINIINQQADIPIEIQFIKSIYYLYYQFENSNEYKEAKSYIESFLLENKMIASYFMNYTNFDKIQVIISSKFDQFIDIFSDQFLISKINTIRSEELKKELISKIIVKKPSFISHQLETILMTSSNDLVCFLIYEISNNYNKFNKSEKENIKKQFQKLLQFNSSSIVHKAIYFYLSKAEPTYFIEQFRTFYKKESYLIKKELIGYLLKIDNFNIYRTILITYINENDKWLKDTIYEEIKKHTEEKISSEMAKEFLKQFNQINEDRFILIKSKFLFYFSPENNINKEIRILALNSIDKNFIEDINDLFSIYLSNEKDYEIFKIAVQITINHKKNYILSKFTYLFTKNPLSLSEYLKQPDYSNFVCNILIFGVDKTVSKQILNYYFPMLKELSETKIKIDQSKLDDFFNSLEGLFTKITYQYLDCTDETKQLRTSLFYFSLKFELDNTLNILLSKEIDFNLIKEYLNIIEKNGARENIVKGLFLLSTKNIEFNKQIISILLKLIEQNKSFNPFLTNIDEELSKNKNFISLAAEFIKISKISNYIFSINPIFERPNEDSYQILYDLFKFILKNNSDSKNKNQFFPYLLKYSELKNIIYLLFLDNEIEKQKKIAIIDLFASPIYFDAADYFIPLLSEKEVDYCLKIIETIGKMNNPEKFSLLKDFVEKNYDIKDIQLQFARSSTKCMSLTIIPYIVKLTEYPDNEVKEAALVALGYLPVSETLPVLYKEYTKNKNPEKLYNYYKNSNDQLKKYWLDYLYKEFDEDKYVDFIIKGVYPYKIYNFDNIILEKLIPITEKPFYNSIILLNIGSVPSSSIEDAITLSPFLFISDDYSKSIKYLKLLSKLKRLDLAQYAILSNNIDTIDYFFSINKRFNDINFTSLFDFVYNYRGKEGLKKIVPVIIKYSKSIGVDNSIDFFLRVNEFKDSYKIILSLYPLSLNFDNCEKILQKSPNLLPLVLKLAEDDPKIYQLFINLIFKNSINFDYTIFELTLSYCKNQLPDPLYEITDWFISNEKREDFKQLGIFYLIKNIKQNLNIDKNLFELIVSNISFDNKDNIWNILDSCQNLYLLSEILDLDKTRNYLDKVAIFKRITNSKSSISNRNYLYSLFIVDQNLFFQYLNSIKQKINDPFLLSLIIKKIDKLNDSSFQIILKSIISLKNKDIILNNTGYSSFDEIIYKLLNKSNIIDHDEYILALNFLTSNLISIKNINDKDNNKDSENKNEFDEGSENFSILKDNRIFNQYKYFIELVAISNINEYEKIEYFNKFFGKTKIKEKEFFEILKVIEDNKELDDNSIKNIYLLLPFVENCHDLSFATDFYLSHIDIFSIPEKFLYLILPKLDKNILYKYIDERNLELNVLKKFVKIIPELLLKNKDLLKTYSEKELVQIYFESNDPKILYYFIENSLISIDKIFFYSKKYEQKIRLTKDLLNYSKLFPISSYNMMNLIQNIPDSKIKNYRNDNFIDNYNFILGLFVYNILEYDTIEKYEILKTILSIMPNEIEKEKFKFDLTLFKEENLLDFYMNILLSSFFISNNKIITFIDNYDLPIYLGFEKLYKSDLEDVKRIYYENNDDENLDFNIIFFYQSIFDLIIKSYQDPQILEKYIISQVKDDFDISLLFWDTVIKYRVPGMIYIFDKYYGGIKWEKIRDSYLKLFK